MSEVILKVSINNSIQEVKGILNEKTNIITYSDKDNTLNKLFLNHKKLLRTSSEQSMLINFNIGQITYETSDGIDLKINIKVISIQSEKDYFKAKYSINDEDKFEYKVVIKKLY